MPPADRPVADIAGSACARAHAAGADGAAIDWRELSHELRTPLNAILGNAELLLDGSTGPLSAQARACLGEIQVAGRRLLRQVQLLLAWSELGASRPRPAACPVDVIALIREALADARPDVVHIEPHDAALPVSGDRFWLHMLVAEIIALPGASGAPPAIALDEQRQEPRALLYLDRLWHSANKCVAARADRGDRAAAGCRGGAQCERLVPALAAATARSAPGRRPRPRTGMWTGRGAVLRDYTIRSTANLECSRRRIGCRRGLSSRVGVPIVIASIR